MLQKLLLSALLSNTVYLGYKKEFVNSKMFVALLGSRTGMDIHNLNKTLYETKKMLFLLFKIWQNYGVLWLIAPKNQIFINIFGGAKDLLWGTLYLWATSWRFGFLSNSGNYPRALRYPSGLFYAHYTGNIMKLKENSLKMIQFSLVDSNSECSYLDFFINANEKTFSSYLYFVNLIYVAAFQAVAQTKKTFILF